MNLVIVESPAKAKTIEGYLGKKFLVKSSNGHVRDLSEKGLSITIENDFEPKYHILPEKKKIIEELKKHSKDADFVWLATDEDREGEAISWHLVHALSLNEKKIKRIVFHEITKPAILKAIDTPRKIDHNLVDAQQARRVLDRLVGYELSPVLWKKIKPSLSAGRVQSVAVRLIVEREREVSSFSSASAFRIIAYFTVKTPEGNIYSFKAELPVRPKTKEDAMALLKKLKGALYTVKNIEKKPYSRTPAPPFTTSTLQQEASRKLRFSVAQTMSVAQRLYESGRITYMRTDSVTLSQTAINAAKDEILHTFGADYANPRQFITKSKSAQEAHEAIRPTYMNERLLNSDEDNQNRLYDLIWKRTLASQMTDAEMEKTVVTIEANTIPDAFIATGEVVRFDGFLKVYFESSDEDDEEVKEGMLPPLQTGQNLVSEEIEATQRFSQPPARYTEASLVKKLEQLGIGRPSTYAPTISTVQKRGYVVKENREGKPRNYQVLILKNDEIEVKEKTEVTGVEKAKLFPTDVGIVVSDFLVANFQQVLDYHFTAKVEKEFDEVAEGQKKWNTMIGEFYEPFHKSVLHTLEHSERASGARLLGVDPDTGKNVYVRIGRFGPMIQLGEGTDKEEKLKFAGLPKGLSMEDATLNLALGLLKLPRNLGLKDGDDVIVGVGKFGPYIKYKGNFYNLQKTDDPLTITLEYAMEVIASPKLPRTLGKFEDADVSVNKGRFGPYVKHKDKFVSLEKTDDPFTIEIVKAIELIQNKRKTEKEKIIKEFKEDTKVKVINGRYGPCINIGKKFFNIPEGTKPEELTLEQCKKIAAAGGKTKRRGKK